MPDYGENVVEDLPCCGIRPQNVGTCDSVEMQKREDIASTDIEAGSSKVDLSRYERWVASITFFFLGMCSIFAWSNILYVMPYVTTQFFDGWDAGNSLLGVYQLGNLTIQLLLLIWGPLHERWLHLGLFLGSILCAAFGPCVIYGSFGTRIAMLHVLCLLLGSGSGFVQGSGVSVAAILPVNQISIYSAGQGFGAIFSVLLIGILSFTALDIDVKDDVAILVHITSAASVAVGVACVALAAVALRQPAAKQALADTRSAEDMAAGSGGPSAAKGAAKRKEKTKSLYKVFKLAGVPIACIFALFFVTCNLFPRVGPAQWHTANPPKNHLVWLFGIFPFGDTFGKCLCTLADKGFRFKKIILFPPKLLPWVTLLRAVLYVPFFLSKHLVDNVVFSSFWCQMLEMVLISVSHGWLATVAFMYSFDAVPDVRDKRDVGPVGILSLIFGIMSGLYFALLYR